MSKWINLIIIGAGLFILFISFFMLKRRKFSENNSIIWLIIAFAMIIVGCYPDMIWIMADWFGIAYAPILIVSITLVYILMVLFQKTIHISRLMSQVQELSMELAIVREEIRSLKEQKRKQEGDIINENSDSGEL